MFNSNNGIPFMMNVEPANSNDGWGGNGGGWFFWFIIIILLVGWGNNGWGGYGAGGIQENYVLTSDMATIERKLDDVNNGLCNGFYTQAQLVNGVTQSIADSNYAIQNGMTQNRIAAMQDNNAITAQITGLGTQLAACCCDQRYETASKFADLNYNIATQDCQIRQTVNDVGRGLADVQNANTQAILAKLDAMENSRKDEKIATLQAQVSDMKLIANNNAQTTVFTNAINDAVQKLQPPMPIPAFQVANPWQYSGCGCNTCGC